MSFGRRAQLERGGGRATEINFYPDGRSEAATVILQSQDGEEERIIEIGALGHQADPGNWRAVEGTWRNEIGSTTGFHCLSHSNDETRQRALDCCYWRGVVGSVALLFAQHFMRIGGHIVRGEAAAWIVAIVLAGLWRAGRRGGSPVVPWLAAWTLLFAGAGLVSLAGQGGWLLPTARAWAIGIGFLLFIDPARSLICRIGSR